VVLVEQDAHLIKTLSALKTRLKADAVRVERGDGVAAMQQRRGQGLDLVFLDPPFGEEGNDALFTAALQAARQCLRDDGLIYLEAPRVWSDDELAQLGLQLHRQGKAGVVAYHLLRPLPPQ
jgi:16S rRNA G966 N2-methylase RsmD